MKFTIALPITKTKYLKQTLSSIDAQIERDFEVIIRNNAKDPKVKEEIKVLCADWINRPYVQYFESEGQLSMSENFNKMVFQSKGEFFTLLSDDDEIEPEFLLEMKRLIEKYPDTDAFHCRVKSVDENDNFLGVSELCPEWENQIELIYHRINYRRYIILSDFVVRTSTLQKIGGFPSGTTAWGIDEITWLKMSKNGLAFTPKVLLKYRVFTGNMSHNPDSMKIRFKDLEFMESEINTMIHEFYKENDAVFPKEYLLDLNKKRTVRQKDDVFINFTRNHKGWKGFQFYRSNKSEISKKGILKGFARIFHLIN